MSSMSSLSSSSSRKRKREWKEVVAVGEQIVSAAADGIAGHTISAVFGGYGELKSVDEQLEHLEWMVTEIGSAVEDAAHVPIRSWSLQQWLFNLQEAACEGKAVARALRERRAAEEAAAGKSGNVLWEGAKLIFRSAKRALMGDEDMDRLSRALRKLERASAGTGRFLKLLEMEGVAGKAESKVRSTVAIPESDLADGAESKVIDIYYGT
ncbi:unnamed protein product [Urochloa decumbens]|uniref:Rx N-terminal domain-containing protein n=1 Tax=Urochloa decumbens TaxID=240449 RepID=A0ABC8Z7Q4_9POAL